MFGPDAGAQTEKTTPPRIRPKLSMSVALERRQPCEILGAPGLVLYACFRRGKEIVVSYDDTTAMGMVLKYKT